MSSQAAPPETRDSSDHAIIILDATKWKSKDDFYDSFFAAVGAPSWHGRNLDALNDSVCTGAINGIEGPYTITIKNFAKMDEQAKRMADRFVEFFRNDLDTPVRIVKGDVLPEEVNGSHE